MSTGGYSSWIWSPEHGRHYCWRYGTNGQVEYHWSGPPTAPVTQAVDSDTPRTTYTQYDNQGSQGRTGGRATAQTEISSDVTRSIAENQWHTSEDHMQQAPRKARPTTLLKAYSAEPGYTSTPGTSNWATPSAQRNASEHSPTYGTNYTTARPLSQRTTSLPAMSEAVKKAVGGELPKRHITTGPDPTSDEPLDPRYRRVSPRHHAEFFGRGRVFKMLWTEPAGTVKGKTRGSTHFSLVRYGEAAYSEIRRFVVIKNCGTFSRCIPIQTYRGQGSNKPGLVVEDHGLIYTGAPKDDPPPLLDGEGITKQPIRVDSKEGELLEPASRINFGKPYAVEHNVKVLEIGTVAAEHMHLLVYYFKDAMAQV